ncbi:LIC_10190 family membrane protein [Flavobacterium sp.]|uniref:LIC_10190 family membrane protein n=1 Tax=Flavobacterium sp. TaxID=239 RepID=UPI003753576D
MFLILLSWIYILLTAVNLGYLVQRIALIKNNNFVITSFLGLFLATVLGSLFAIFYRINIEFHLMLFSINLILVIKFKNEIKQVYSSLFKEIKSFIFPLKIIFVTLTLLIIAQCATKPYIIDNESYYIQTIKWINEYGFVKGLANLHLFFGQTSGWHISQSIFNFSFLYKNFNDLSGFCLLLGTLFSIQKLNNYFKNESKIDLIFGLFPLANVFFFQFISAPSPDIAVYVLTFIVFYLFIENYKECSTSNFNLISLLILYILFIKTISIVLIIIPVVLLTRNFKILKTNLIPVTLFSLIVLILFLVKNIILTGYPLFPTTLFANDSLNYEVPKNLMAFYFNKSMLYEFFLTTEELNSLTNFQIFLKWIGMSRLDGIINLSSLLILFISPLFIYKLINKKSIWILYFIIIFQMIVLFFSSPQFRFFIHLILFLSFIIFASLFYKKSTILQFNYLSILMIIIILFFPISYKSLTQNKLISKNSIFLINNLVFPHDNSKVKNTYQKIKIGNLIYNSPINNDFFWGNGNGKLPCVNQQQLDYFEKYFNVIPQMRTTNLKDGFYAKKLSPNE